MLTTLRPLPDGAKCFDCYQPLTAATAADMRARGFVAAGRYIENLSLAEVAAILGSGLGLLAISECQKSGWMPVNGGLKGAWMVNRSRALGLPFGLPLVIDWETPSTAATLDDCEVWLEGAASTVVAGGYVAALYWGACPILSGVEAWAIPSVTLYYKSASTVPAVPCGYVLVQTAVEQRVGALTVDLDTAQADQHDPPRRMVALFAGDAPATMHLTIMGDYALDKRRLCT